MPFYIPKGSMCANCKNRFKDCSKLDFKSMRPLVVDGEMVVVKCTEYKSEEYKKMKVTASKIDGYTKVREINSDPYGCAILQYAEYWATLMEQAIDRGEELKNVAKDLSYKADTEGITGFMYGAAVAHLSYFWEHGEELRRWHNLDCQIGNEGEKANESGGVISPAMLSIG